MASVLTVSQINTYLKSVIDDDINLKNIFITGEISNFTNHYRTGHFYFTLKDEKSSMKAVMFRSAAEKLRFMPEDGMKVLIRGKVSVFERDGIYQIYCDDMIPDGVGQLTLEYEQLKEKLQKRGMFDPERKKSLPKFPGRVGVITSPTGAAIEDILSVLTRRYPCAQIVFEPVQVQGDSAAGQICAAIERFNLLKGADVIIVGRGGGSIEDLWAFNEEAVAHAIYASEIPIISAVGHETDFTIADFVADLRAPTPSAAAELAVPDYCEILYSVDKTLDIMTETLQRRIDSYTIELMKLENVISSKSPMKTLELYSDLLNAFSAGMNDTMEKRLTFYTNALSHYAANLENMSPLKVLARGYAIAKDSDGFTVKKASNFKKDDKIFVTMSDGEIECTVDEVKIKKCEDDNQELKG